MAFEKQNYLEPLRARLKSLAARFGQAEIARRTDTPPANVHRYLREGKVPVEFCAALVSEFHVSPIWLIEGRGGMLRSDVRKPIADMGGDLLELVETMNAVSRMRLGAVAGRHDRKTLRELGEAMDAFDRLREKLNVHSRPLMQGVLNEWAEAQVEMDMDRAGSLRHTARLLARLTTDEQLLERLDANEGGFAYLTGELENAVEYERRVFARRVMKGRIDDEHGLIQARNLAMSVRDTGRLKEARRLTRAAIALAEERCRDSSVMHQLRMFEAHLDADLGDLRAGLDLSSRTFAVIRDDHFFSGIIYASLQMLAGIWTFEQTLGFGEMSAGKARMLTRYAAMAENPDYLAQCLPGLVGSPPQLLPEDEYDTRLAQLVFDLLNGRKRKVSHYDRLLSESPPRIPSPHLREVMVHLHRAQIARLAGDRASLKKECAVCEEAWRKVPEELTVKLDWLLPHQRNLEAIPPRQRSDAHRLALERVQSEIETHIRNGYRLFVPS